MFSCASAGYLHVGYAQTAVIKDTDADVPFNAHVYETGHIHYPKRTFFQKTKLYSSGKVRIIVACS